MLMINTGDNTRENGYFGVDNDRVRKIDHVSGRVSTYYRAIWPDLWRRYEPTLVYPRVLGSRVVFVDQTFFIYVFFSFLFSRVGKGAGPIFTNISGLNPIIYIMQGSWR